MAALALATRLPDACGNNVASTSSDLAGSGALSGGATNAGRTTYGTTSGSISGTAGTASGSSSTWGHLLYPASGYGELPASPLGAPNCWCQWRKYSENHLFIDNA